jgi:hypothetical protein
MRFHSNLPFQLSRTSFLASRELALAPHTGAFGAVAAHFYLVAAFKQRSPKLPILWALPQAAEGLL